MKYRLVWNNIINDNERVFDNNKNEDSLLGKVSKTLFCGASVFALSVVFLSFSSAFDVSVAQAGDLYWNGSTTTGDGTLHGGDGTWGAITTN